MLRITQLKLPVGHTEEQLKKKLLKAAHMKENDLKTYTIRKRSLDARKNRNCITFILLIFPQLMRGAFSDI